MFTGEVPYPGDNVYAAMRAKMRKDPTPPRRLHHVRKGGEQGRDQSLAARKCIRCAATGQQ